MNAFLHFTIIKDFFYMQYSRSCKRCYELVKIDNWGLERSHKLDENRVMRNGTFPYFFDFAYNSIR